MSIWSNLNHAIQATIASGRIGTPVFVRATFVLTDTPMNESQFIAMLVDDVSHWFSSAPSRIFSQPSTRGDHLSLTVEYPSGVMALLSLAFGQPQGQIDLALLGNRGAAYHKEAAGIISVPFIDAALIARTSELQPAIAAALQANRPIMPGQEAGS